MVTTFFPPYHFGGDATYVWHLSNALAERGHEVTVIHNVDAYRILGGTERGVASGAHAGVEAIPIVSSTPRLAPLVVYLTGRPGILSRTLRDIFSTRSFDVVHFHNISLMGGPGILPFGDGIKLYTMHEHWLVCPMHVLWKNDRRPCEKPACLRCTASFRRPPQLWRYTGHLERSLEHVDVFLSPSEFTASMHHERGFRHPIRVFPYFVPTPNTGLAFPEPAQPYFLFVGRLERIKGIRELIDVFGRYVKADLVIAGDGTLREAVRDQAEVASQCAPAGPCPTRGAFTSLSRRPGAHRAERGVRGLAVRHPRSLLPWDAGDRPRSRGAAGADPGDGRRLRLLE